MKSKLTFIAGGAIATLALSACGGGGLNNSETRDDHRSCYQQSSGYHCELVGLALYHGDGEDQDVGNALNYFRRGCSLGQASSCGNWARVVVNEDAVTQDDERLLTRLERSCRKYDFESCEGLSAALSTDGFAGYDPERADAVREVACGDGLPWFCAQ